MSRNCLIPSNKEWSVWSCSCLSGLILLFMKKFCQVSSASPPPLSVSNAFHWKDCIFFLSILSKNSQSKDWLWKYEMIEIYGRRKMALLELRNNRNDLVLLLLDIRNAMYKSEICLWSLPWNAPMLKFETKKSARFC